MLKYLWYTHIKEYCAAFKNHIVRWSDVQHCLKEKAHYKSRLLYTQRGKIFKRYANSYCHRWTYEWILKSSFACKFSPFFSTVMCIAFEIRQGRMGNNKNYFISQGKKRKIPLFQGCLPASCSARWIGSKLKPHWSSLLRAPWRSPWLWAEASLVPATTSRRVIKNEDVPGEIWFQSTKGHFSPKKWQFQNSVNF